MNRTVTVRLLKSHTHAGQPQPVGAEIDVSAADAAWMTAHAVAEPVRAKRNRFKPDADAGQYLGNPSEPSHEEDDHVH